MDPQQNEPGADLIRQIEGGKSISARIRTALHGWLRAFTAANRQGAPNEAVTTYIGSQTPLIGDYETALLEGSEATRHRTYRTADGDSLLARVGCGSTVEDRLETMFAGWRKGVSQANGIGTPNLGVADCLAGLSTMSSQYFTAIVESEPMAHAGAGAGSGE